MLKKWPIPRFLYPGLYLCDMYPCHMHYGDGLFETTKQNRNVYDLCDTSNYPRYVSLTGTCASLTSHVNGWTDVLVFKVFFQVHERGSPTQQDSTQEFVITYYRKNLNLYHRRYCATMVELVVVLTWWFSLATFLGPCALVVIWSTAIWVISCEVPLGYLTFNIFHVYIMADHKFK